MDNAEWLKWLDDEIWESKIDAGIGLYFEVKRKLTLDESKRLREIAGTHEFVIEPCSMDFSFGFGLVFHTPGPFPGVPAGRILSVNGKHLPEHNGAGPNFEQSWDLLSPLSHNPENERLLNFHDFPGLREKEHYYY